MKKLCLVSLNELNANGLDSKIRISPNNMDVDLSSSIGDDSDLTSDTETVSSTGEICQKRKRQRLTHLTNEEKMMRRKLKNRVAAQSARDRKKVKFDDLAVTCDQLKEQNERLKKENAILKENAQLLINENRKLLKFKSDTEKSQSSKPIILQPVLKQQQDLNNIVSIIAPSKLHSSQTFLEADESAVFTTYAFQPKRQLQGMFQRIIYMLILQTLGLIRGELLNSTGNTTTTQTQQQAAASQIKLAKLKLTLAKLYRMASARRMIRPPKPEKSIQIMNTYKTFQAEVGVNKKNNGRLSAVNLALLVSMIVQALDTSRDRRKQ